MTLRWQSWAATDIGTVRAGNEDAYLDQPGTQIWAVADGAGGHEHGEIAAQALRDALAMPFENDSADLVTTMRARVAAVHAALRFRAAQEQEEAGRPVTIASTIVILVVRGEHFACLWCGDSRAYLLRRGAFTQITRDHSLVQEMIDSGALAANLAERHPHANVLTRAVGAPGPAPELDKIIGTAEPGDRFLLCSDGLFKVLNETAIGTMAAGPNPAQALIRAALAAAARDNVTAIVISATGLGDVTTSAPPDPTLPNATAYDTDEDGTLNIKPPTSRSSVPDPA